MVPFRSEIVIRRPIADVFAYVAAPENYAKWMNGVSGAKASSNSFGTGTQVQIDGRMGMWNADAPMQVTTYEPPRAIGLKGSVGPMLFDGTWEFEAAEDSATRVTVSGNVQMMGLWRLAEPLFAGEVRNGEAQELVKIKQQLEG